MIFEIENNIIKSLKILGGCPGNTVGVSKLVEGKNIDEVIKLLKRNTMQKQRNILSRSNSTSTRKVQKRKLVKFI